MTYHSESITRRYIGYSQFHKFKNRGRVRGPENDAMAEQFSKEWEECSLSSATFAQKSSYFALGSAFFSGMTIAMLALSFLLLKMVEGYGWGPLAGFLFLPFTLFASVWAAFAWRSNRSKMIRDYFSPFTSYTLVMCILVAVGICGLLVLLINLIMDPTVERWI